MKKFLFLILLTSSMSYAFHPSYFDEEQGIYGRYYTYPKSEDGNCTICNVTNPAKGKTDFFGIAALYEMKTIKQKKMNTFLLAAVEAELLAGVKLAIENGADNIKEAFEKAQENKFLEIAEYLKNLR